MSLICVDYEQCARDGLCVEACPPRIIALNEDGYPVVAPGNEASCIGCGHCVAICPHRALSHTGLSPEAFLPAARPKPGFEAEVEALMRSRRSVREYKAEPVDRAVLDELLDVARFAPTAVNSQQLGWIVVQDPAKTASLAGTVATWMRAVNALPRYIELLDKGGDVVLRGAPHVVMAHAPASYGFAETDCVIALSYLELAAAARGLGTCWAGILTRAAQNDAATAQALGVPEGHKVFGGLMLGRPKYRYRLVPPRNPVNVRWI